MGWLGRRQASHTIARTRTRRAREERGGACASEATANKPLLQYHSEPMAFLTHQARYYFIVARSRALFELSHCSTASSSPSTCPTTDTHTAIARCYLCYSLLQTQYHTTKLPLPALPSSLQVTYIFLVAYLDRNRRVTLFGCEAPASC